MDIEGYRVDDIFHICNSLMILYELLRIHVTRYLRGKQFKKRRIPTISSKSENVKITIPRNPDAVRVTFIERVNVALRTQASDFIGCLI